MAAVRDIIIHVEVQVASAKRICHHNRKEHGIAKGQKCLAIRDADGSRKNYCLPCATVILEKAKRKLLELERDIQLSCADPAVESSSKFDRSDRDRAK